MQNDYIETSIAIAGLEKDGNLSISFPHRKGSGEEGKPSDFAIYREDDTIYFFYKNQEIYMDFYSRGASIHEPEGETFNWRSNQSLELVKKLGGWGVQILNRHPDYVHEIVEHMAELLGSESGNKWLIFMDYIHRNLSGIVDKRGAPSAETIKNSLIGEAGFTSWKAMIQAPTSEGGLGWNLSSWDLWKRSYRIVQKYPYLRDLELTASEIKTLYNETKDAFPTDIEAFNDYQASRMEIIESKRQNSLSNAQKVNDELSLELSSLKEQVSTLSQQLETSSQENQRLSADLTTSTQSITTLTAENAVLKTKLEAAEQLLIERGEELSSGKAALAELQKKHDIAKTNADKRKDKISNYNNSSWWKKLITLKL